MSMPSHREGVTLIELVVTIVLIGVIASVATLAFPPDRTPVATDPATIIARARTKAAESARPVTVSVMVNGTLFAVSALPDGSVIADTALRVDRLSGRR